MQKKIDFFKILKCTSTLILSIIHFSIYFKRIIILSYIYPAAILFFVTTFETVNCPKVNKKKKKN